MFPAARCFVPRHPQPHATIPCRRAPPPTTVSAKPRRWTRGGPRRDRSWDDDGGGGGGSDSDIDDGFFGQEQDDDEPEREERAPGRLASPAPEGGQLRGSDVLRALQRAAAAKAAARTKKDKKPAAWRQGKEKPEGGGGVEVGEVKPVVIRPEWAARIRELELRVQQLAGKYHHHQ